MRRDRGLFRAPARAAFSAEAPCLKATSGSAISSSSVPRPPWSAATCEGHDSVARDPRATSRVTLTRDQREPPMAKKSDEEKYTDPELRERIKEEIKQSDKGGNPGQWSARKSQLLTQEYERRGGGYRGEKDEAQQNLERWTDEEWQTQDGGERARDDGETARRSEEHTSELQSRQYLVCRLLLEKKNNS